MRFRGWLATVGLFVLGGLGSLFQQSLLGFLLNVVVLGYLVSNHEAFEEW